MAAQYATTDDLNVFGLGPNMFASIPLPIKQRILDAASAVADSHLGSRFALPLESWGDDIRRAVVHIATLDLLMLRGFNPDDPTHALIAQRAQAAADWLENVSDGNVTPLVVQGASSAASSDPGAAFAGQVQVVGTRSSIPLDGMEEVELLSSGPRIQIGPPSLRGW